MQPEKQYLEYLGKSVEIILARRSIYRANKFLGPLQEVTGIKQDEKGNRPALL